MGRETLWNLPNTITMLRIGVVPLLLILPWVEGEGWHRFLAWTFLIAALSDLVDGWLARRGQQVTRIGKLLDPLADKLLVSSALIMLLAAGVLEPWTAPMIVVIVGRELAVTGLRGIASAGGQVMGAKGAGKLKAVAQNAAVVALLFHYETFGLPAHEVGLVFLVIATGLTLWSGWYYFADFFGNTGAEEATPGEEPS